MSAAVQTQPPTQKLEIQNIKSHVRDPETRKILWFDANHWCGPSAISAVTPLTSGEAARLIRHQSGKKMVTGTYVCEVREALRACNIELVPLPIMGFFKHDPWKHLRIKKLKKDGHPLPTLRAWLEDTKVERSHGGIYLVSAGQHWQLISGDDYVCGKTEKIVPLSSKHESIRFRSIVSYVYKLASTGVCWPDAPVLLPAQSGFDWLRQNELIAE